jgi:hypothetical protein
MILLEIIFGFIFVTQIYSWIRELNIHHKKINKRR